MTICPKLNCTYLETPGQMIDPPSLNQDPDISGYGVLIGFTGTGYITLVLLIIQYILGFTPDSDANPIDRGIIQWIWKKKARRPSWLWGRALEKSILLMSDQQMITGIAILASGYFQLCSENSNAGIVSYDWQIIVYLGWFSSLTHLTTLTALRKYMIEHPTIRLWRLLLMLTIVVMLIIALIPTMQLGWFYSPRLGRQSGGGVYAGCYYRSLGKPYYQVDTDGLLSMIISLVVLTAGYVSKTIKLFPKQSNFVRWLFRTAPGNWWKRRLDKIYRRSKQKRETGCLGNFDRIRYRGELSLLLSAKAILDLYHSVVWEVLWLFFGVAWGTLHLMFTKVQAQEPANEQGKDSEWGFGQFLSTFLLALPILNLAEACYEASGKLQEGRSLHEEHTGRLGSMGSNTTTPHGARPVAAQSSATLIASPSSQPTINLRALTFDTVTEETLIPKNTGDNRSPSPYLQTLQTQPSSLDFPPSPGTEINNLSLLYPLHHHDSYEFPWFQRLIIAMIIEVVQLGVIILYLFSLPSMEIEQIFVNIAPFWIEVCSVIPACVVYVYTCLTIHERKETSASVGKPVWKSPGLLALMFWKWCLLVYIPGVTLAVIVEMSL